MPCPPDGTRFIPRAIDSVLASIDMQNAVSSINHNINIFPLSTIIQCGREDIINYLNVNKCLRKYNM